ncbi:MAG TPA: hypothetical protein VIV82_04370 [Verrucomicrobiae bacterium]
MIGIVKHGKRIRCYGRYRCIQKQREEPSKQFPSQVHARDFSANSQKSQGTKRMMQIVTVRVSESERESVTRSNFCKTVSFYLSDIAREKI